MLQLAYKENNPRASGEQGYELHRTHTIRPLSIVWRWAPRYDDDGAWKTNSRIQACGGIS
jgi:hypothetical protein